MIRHWVRLQFRFETPNAIASGGLKWQYIAIIATLSSIFLVNRTKTKKYCSPIYFYLANYQ